jgi:glycosyltransferase involved in cell wall biosynthesis
MKDTLYINGSFLASSRLSGVQRYGIEITRQLIKDYSQKNKNLIIVTNKVFSENIKREFSNYLKIYPSNKIIFEQIILPWISKGNKLLSLANSGPVFHFNHYFVLHDTLVYDFPKSFTKKFRIFYKFLWFSISKTAKHFFTVSEFSKNQISKHLNLKIANISIASNGYEHLENIKSDNKIIYSEYILFVGSFTDHKNFNLLVELYNKNPEKYPKLIMAGGFNKKVFNNTEINSKNIIFVQDFSDEVLVNLYKNCSAVVFPSKFEGFGIPLLECIYFNKPIICSDIPVFREIGNDYPNYFDLENIEELKYFLKKIKNGSQLRKGNNEKILQKYSWKNSLKSIKNKI